MSKTIKSEYRKCNRCGKRVMADEGEYTSGKFYCDDCAEVIGSFDFQEDYEEAYPN